VKNEFDKDLIKLKEIYAKEIESLMRYYNHESKTLHLLNVVFYLTFKIINSKIWMSFM
jgi:hypothetical protein